MTIKLLLVCDVAFACIVSQAQWRDLAGMSGVVCQAFRADNKDEPRFVNALARRSAWMVALGKRLGAVERGELSPHNLLVARDRFGIVGLAEIGLLPAPPGVLDGIPSALCQPNAEWRGVPLTNVIAFANDVPTIANVAVAKRARRRKIGTRLVEHAMSIIADDPDWAVYRQSAMCLRLYARVTDPQAQFFWANCGFDEVQEAMRGQPDVRGQAGVWLARDLNVASQRR